MHSHQYSRFSRISSNAANRYRRRTSLLKYSVSITSISYPIKLVNIAFQSVPCIHAEWAILGDDVCAASRTLIFCWNTATGPKYIDRVPLRPNVEINCNDGFFSCDIFSEAGGMLKSLCNHQQSQQPTRRNGRIVGGRCWENSQSSMVIKSSQLSLYQQTGRTGRKYDY